MKLAPVVETTNPEAPAIRRMADCNCCDMSAQRPYETEADLIAAAAWPGLVTRQPMVLLKVDADDKEYAHYDTREYGRAMRVRFAANLSEFDVEWDPTIRL